MKASLPPTPAERPERLVLNRWLQTFLTIIAGAAVAVIAWSVIQRFLHIIALLVASFLVAFLFSPLVNRMEKGGVRRPVAILIVYLGLFSVLAVVVLLLLGPLTQQLTSLLRELPALINTKAGGQNRLDTFFHQHGLNVTTEGLRKQLAGYVTSTGATLLGSTLSIVAGTIGVITDLLLVLAITFYLLLDGHAMHNRGVRLLPSAYRERWFFVEATLNKVLGGYLRGQLIVALTVGIAAGLGCTLLGVQYSLVIGLLAFLFELIPMIGPVLGMVPAVLISFFQSPSPVVWVIVFFIVLQQVESNAIVPRVSGHAVGLHPLAALLALLVGVELGGLGGALLSVPIAGVLWVLLVTFYGDATGQTHVLTSRPRSPYVALARGVLDRTRGRSAATAPADDLDGPMPVASDRLAAIKHEQEHLMQQFEATEDQQAAAESLGQGDRGPDETRAADVV